jgi:hypothetical protein
MCQVCIATGRFFVSELKRFTLEELEQHQIHGAPENGLDGHPLCTFCRPQRFYDDQELYHHMIKEHYQCDLCRNMGNGNRFFKSYEVLNGHFQEQHYICEQPECVLNRFVVFQNEIELQGHMARSHPKVKFKRNIMINFTVGRGIGRDGGRGSTGAGRGVHSSGSGSSGNSGNRGGRSEMNFSDAFMRSQGSTGGQSPNGSGAAAAVLSNGSSFPTLQEQQRHHQEQGERKKTNKTRRGSKGAQMSTAALVATSTAASVAASTAAAAAASALTSTVVMVASSDDAGETKDGKYSNTVFSSSSKEGWICSICTMSNDEHQEQDVAWADSVFELPACAHAYHTQCLAQWISASNANADKSSPTTCPNCRMDIDVATCNAVQQKGAPIMKKQKRDAKLKKILEVAKRKREEAKRMKELLT